MTDEGITEEQAQAMLRQFAEAKSNAYSFLTDVVHAQDSTKIGNLTIEELGEPGLEFRGLKELEAFSKDVYSDNTWSNFFKKLAEITSASSLSKEGFLMRLSVTSKKEMADTTVQERKRNSGWYKKKQ